MKISANGLRFISFEEGVRLDVYLDQLALPTVGIGHLVASEKEMPPQGPIKNAQDRAAWLAARLAVGQAKFPNGVTQEEALELFRKDLERFENAVTNAVKVELSQNQYDALVSLAFNIGTVNFVTSTLVRKLNVGDFVGASEQFASWRMGGGKVLPVLVKRREREKALFLKAV